MSCDNLLGNGDVTRRMLLAFLELRDPSLRSWVAANGAFPNSMVDRITPATTRRDPGPGPRASSASRTPGPWSTEPFKQWVIEDRFCLGRPAWEDVGVLMTDDVLPYEKMKLRLLNGSHQAMCYIGMLLGYTTVHEALCDARIRRLIRRFMDRDVTPLLPAVAGIDLEEYKDSLIERFINPAIRDQLSRLGTEGSARVPKFVLPSILEQLSRGGSIRSLAFVVASWFRYLAGADDRGRALPINDPMAARLGDLARRGVLGAARSCCRWASCSGACSGPLGGLRRHPRRTAPELPRSRRGRVADGIPPASRRDAPAGRPGGGASPTGRAAGLVRSGPEVQARQQFLDRLIHQPDPPVGLVDPAFQVRDPLVRPGQPGSACWQSPVGLAISALATPRR